MEIHNALEWITEILNRLQIPYQVVGGLAARCYGSTRPLHDIDFCIPKQSMAKLQNEVRDYIVFGPTHHKDEIWDIVFMKLNYEGQQIEFGDADHIKYFDSQSQQWIKEKIDFASSISKEFEGIMLPVMPKPQLLAYKYRLNREADKIDLQEIESQE